MSAGHAVCRKNATLHKAFLRVHLVFFMARGPIVEFLDTRIITDLAGRQSTVGREQGKTITQALCWGVSTEHVMDRPHSKAVQKQYLGGGSKKIGTWEPTLFP